MTLISLNDRAPTGARLTDYDVAHGELYLRLLDAEAAGQDWRIMAVQLFGLDVAQEPRRARRTVASHLRRARWMRDIGYKQLLSARHSPL